MGKVAATGEIRKGDIGYIKINSFSEGAASQVAGILKNFDARNIQKIVIDLCDNPGGEQKELLEMFNLFAPEGPVLNVTFGKQKVQYSSCNKNFGKYRLVILVNGNSASAAEACAGTLKDRGAAIIVGEKTYGKGTVFRLSEEKRGEGLVLSIGTYTTAAGTNVNHIGIMPDIFSDSEHCYEKAAELICNKNYRR